MGELVSFVVSKEKEDLDEIILTKTRLENGIQVCLDSPPPVTPPTKTVSKGIQVGTEEVTPKTDPQLFVYYLSVDCQLKGLNRVIEA